MEGNQRALALLESALSRSGCRWRWASVMVKKPVGGAFDFSHFSERRHGVATPCHEIPGEPLTLIVPTNAWQATGRDLAAFPDDHDRLLELFPEYPNALVTLPDAPEYIPSIPGWNNSAAAALASEARDLEHAASWCSQLAGWLERCAALVTEAVAKVEAEGADLRKTIKGSSYQDWHINALDPVASVVSVMGRPMLISQRRPAGTTEDLSTLHIDTIISQLWKAKYRPVVRIEAADYGTTLVKITLARGDGPTRAFWVDLKAMALVKRKRGKAPRALRRKTP